MGSGSGSGGGAGVLSTLTLVSDCSPASLSAGMTRSLPVAATAPNWPGASQVTVAGPVIPPRLPLKLAGVQPAPASYSRSQSTGSPSGSLGVTVTATGPIIAPDGTDTVAGGR